MNEREIFFGLDNLFGELSKHWFEKQFPGNGIENRWKIFNAPVVACLFIMQKASTRNSLASAIEFFRSSKSGSGIDNLLGGSRRLAMKSISASTGGLSQARQRLSVENAAELFDEINLGMARLNNRLKAEGEKKSKQKWFLLDGTTIGLQNTTAIKEEFPALSNQTGECRPCARAVFAHNLYDAIAQHPAIGKMVESEQALGKQVMRRLPKGSGLIADRNFGIFSIAYHAQNLGLNVLVRMTEVRAARLVGKDTITNDGTYDVVWTASKADCATNPDIPVDAHVAGKLTVVSVERYGYRTERMFFFNTDFRMTPEQTIAVYKERWLIENDIRTLKSTVHLDIVFSKTPDMVRKEIFFGILAYNMIRALIAKAAAKVNLKPRDISFSRAAGIITTTASHLADATTPLQVEITIEAFYKSIYQVKHPVRSKPRWEPRAIVTCRKSHFPYMKGSRNKIKANILKNLN